MDGDEVATEQGPRWGGGRGGAGPPYAPAGYKSLERPRAAAVQLSSARLGPRVEGLIL